ncbi:cupin domain-containing protein [Geminocystis herdmanii]|uniref:cupin domain-containing protein n=1 Tax=Geminocystis herdmanii TaxID=669359 RepID=UPI0003495074|nr:cupin domain-containing protein [Geminocystis herdmanii]
MKTVNNLWHNLPSLTNGEDFSELLKCGNITIERIVSSNQPDDKIYCQNQDEWVILLEGKAQLKIKDDLINLQAGDYLFIPSQTLHQVVKTSVNCVWLAVHIYPYN